jgi:hypothetical protein
MKSEVSVNGATVQVRTLTVTKALLKQARVFKYAPPRPFCNILEHSTEVLPEFAVGWFRGCVIGDEDNDYVLFAKDGDIMLGKMMRVMRWKLPDTVKQLYI